MKGRWSAQASRSERWMQAIRGLFALWSSTLRMKRVQTAQALHPPPHLLHVRAQHQLYHQRPERPLVRLRQLPHKVAPLGVVQRVEGHVAVVRLHGGLVVVHQG